MASRYTFPKSRRLHSREDFSAVYDARVREARGPLMIYARPNSLAYLRMGLSTSRKVGTADRRNRIRRLLRESFRLLQHNLPAGYDLFIIVRPHEPLALTEYQKLLESGVAKLHSVWERRGKSPKDQDIPRNLVE